MNPDWGALLNQVRAFLSLRFRCLSSWDAEDVAQTTLLKLLLEYQKARNLDAIMRLYRKVALCSGLMLLRERRRRHCSSLESTFENGGDDLCHDRVHPHGLSSEETVEPLLGVLNGTERRVLELRICAGLDSALIGRTLGVSVRSVQRHIMHIRQKLDAVDLSRPRLSSSA